MSDILSPTTDAKRAIQLIHDIQNLKIIIKSKDSDIAWRIMERFKFILREYELRKCDLILPQSFVDTVIDTYNEALSLGMIQCNVDNEKENLKKEVIRLRGMLGLQESTDKPKDSVFSDVEDG